MTEDHLEEVKKKAGEEAVSSKVGGLGGLGSVGMGWVERGAKKTVATRAVGRVGGWVGGQEICLTYLKTNAGAGDPVWEAPG